MTYNVAISDGKKKKRKRKNPLPSLTELDRKYREEEQKRYRESPNQPMPSMVPVQGLQVTIQWPERFK